MCAGQVLSRTLVGGRLLASGRSECHVRSFYQQVKDLANCTHFVGIPFKENRVKKRVVRASMQLFLLVTVLIGIPVLAQDASQSDEGKAQGAKDNFAKLRLLPGRCQFLAQLALESFKSGDHGKAAQLAVVLEGMWDGSVGTGEIGRNSPETFKAIDISMDKFTRALRNPKSDASAVSNASAAYNAYIATLQLTPLSEVLSKTMADKSVDAAVLQFREFRTKGFPGIYVFQDDLNKLGYHLLGKGDKAAAIRVFQLNVELYPESANVYDSVGEAYAASEQRDLAIENYRKALSIDPNFESSKAALAKLTAQGQ
jgi:tetratricopeptide (TPR) repeat protein